MKSANAVVNFDVEAATFNEENPGAPVSLFACRYPGRYREAAHALRKIRKQLEERT